MSVPQMTELELVQAGPLYKFFAAYTERVASRICLQGLSHDYGY